MNTAVAVPSPSPSLLGGPRTPEGNARSAQNARRHGLRARDFGLAPDEDPAEWGAAPRRLRARIRAGGPARAEPGLRHRRRDVERDPRRSDAGRGHGPASRPPAPGHSHGSDAQAPAHALSPSTAIRYQTAAGMAVQRAQRTLLAYRKAVLEGLIVPQPVPAEPANENLAHAPPGTDEPGHAEPQRRNCTNELSPRPCEPGNCTGEREDCTPATANDTYEPGSCMAEPPERMQVPGDGTREPGQPGRPPLPAPLAALRARLDRLLRQGAASSPGDRDLLAAMRGLKLPGAAHYSRPDRPRPAGPGSGRAPLRAWRPRLAAGIAERTDAGATQGGNQKRLAAALG